jgi:hypothetical protein
MLVKHLVGVLLGLAAVGFANQAAGYTLYGATIFTDFGGLNDHVAVSSGVLATESISEVTGGVTLGSRAYATFGPGGPRFHASSTSQGTVTTSSPALYGFLESASLAGFQDTVTVSSPDHSGSGTLAVYVGYDGSESGGGSGQFFGGTFGDSCSDPVALTCSVSSPALSQVLVSYVLAGGPDAASATGTVFVGSIPFTYDDPVSINFHLLVNSGIIAPGVGDTVNVTNDFYDTAYLRPFVVYDSNGVSDTSATISSDTSALVYAVTVPEPSSWAIATLGVGLVGGGLRRTRSRPYGARGLRASARA